MKKDWKYIIYLAVIVGLFVTVKLFEKKQNSWNVTLAHDDTEPYGTYAFNELVPALFKSKFRNSYKTIYELKDSLPTNGNFISISTGFNADKADTEALLKFVERGGHAFISAHHFSSYFADTLGLSTSDYLFKNGNILDREDSSYLYFSNPLRDTTRQFSFKRDDVHNYFSRLDSAKATIVSKNDRYNPVTLKIEKGKGVLILNCTPMAFTNIYLLSARNNDYISHSLSYLTKGETYRTEYYHLGRMEAGTPLRFILTTEPLKWAYYITVISILLFMIFEAKRKQRIIPVIPPVTNTSLEFVSTIGNLYFQKGDHKNIAEKKIQFFLEQVRTHYYMQTTQRDELFIQNLSRKSGQNEAATRNLIRVINDVLSSPQISKEMLMELNRQLEKFKVTGK